MANTVLIKRSGTANSVPAAGNISLGELAINYADGLLFYKNASGNVVVLASSNVTNTGADRIVNGTSNVVVAPSGNVTVAVAGTPNVSTFTSTGQLVSGTISASGNITGGNLLTGGLISATGNITSAANVTGGNILTGGAVSATGNVSGGNLNVTGNIVDTGALSIITGSNGNIALAPNGTGIVTASSAFSATGNITGGNILTAGLISSQGTITGSSLFGSTVSVTGAVNGASASVSGGVTAASVSGGVMTGTSISVTGTATAASTVGGVITGSSVSVTGTATAASTVGGVITGTTVSTTGNITTAATANISTGNLSVTNAFTSGSYSTAGNITGGNVLTGGQVSATGNVTGANLVVTTNIYDATTMTLVTGAGDIQLQPAGNIALGNRFITGVATPSQATDAVNKQYVDNAVSTTISYHTPVFAATNTTLASATGGTISYNQPNGVGNGQGAFLQTTGTFTLIDTANIATVGTRILVKNEANGAFNGVYVYSNATVITRASQENTYGAGNVDALGLNDYFFVQSGNVNYGSAFIVSAPTGTITFGTSNIQFSQFSQSQVYTANTSAGLSLVGTVFSAKVDNNTTAFDGNGNITVKAGANLTTPNIGAATGTSLSVTGGVTAASVAGGVITGTSTSVTGGVTAASVAGGVITGTSVSVTGSISSASESVSGNITGGNILTGGLISATGNITSAANVSLGNLLLTGNIVDSGALTIITGSNGNIALAPNGTGQVTVSTALSVTGNITGANVNGVGVFKNGVTVLNADDTIDGGTY